MGRMIRISDRYSYLESGLSSSVCASLGLGSHNIRPATLRYWGQKYNRKSVARLCDILPSIEHGYASCSRDVQRAFRIPRRYKFPVLYTEHGCCPSAHILTDASPCTSGYKNGFRIFQFDFSLPQQEFRNRSMAPLSFETYLNLGKQLNNIFASGGFRAAENSSRNRDTASGNFYAWICLHRRLSRNNYPDLCEVQMWFGNRRNSS